MRIAIELRTLRELKFHEYAIRFVAGGTITAAAGMIAEKWGPGIGGLFLAFPAILPATVTMIANHERRRKKEAEMHGTMRGRTAAGADAAGASIGGIALCVFAITMWQTLTRIPAWAVLGGGTALWFGAAYGAYAAWRRRKRASASG